MRLTVIMPVFNEAGTLEESINQVLSQKVGEMIVVDDGSTDQTPQILKSIKHPKVKVLTHTANKGKGSAIRTALGQAQGEYIIIQDADLEYHPKEYLKLLEKAAPGMAVYGSRLLVDTNKHAYLSTYLGNVLLTSIFNILYKQHLTDTYTCYKLLPSGVARKLNLSSSGFEIEAEITAKLIKKSIKIVEVPIKFKPRKYEDGKKIKFKDAVKGLWTLLKIRFS